MPRNLLGPEFVRHRGDVTLSGREELVTFMRDSRPQKGTRYAIEHYIQSKSDDEIIVRDHLEDGDGDELLIFLDRFQVRDGKLSKLGTFIKSSTAN